MTSYTRKDLMRACAALTSVRSRIPEDALRTLQALLDEKWLELKSEKQCEVLKFVGYHKRPEPPKAG